MTQLSLPHLQRHTTRTLLTVLSVAAGVAAVAATGLVSDSVLRSFENAVEVSSGGADFHLDGGGTPVSEVVLDSVRSVEGVRSASGLVEGAVSVSGDAGMLLTVLGFDLLAAPEEGGRVGRDALTVPDEMEFIASPSSAALPAGLADALGLEIGDAFEVVTPSGIVSLTMRGRIDAAAIENVFDGELLLMDLPAAQLLLGKDALVDRIDLHVADGADKTAVRMRLDDALAGRALIVDARERAGRARDILLSLRVILALVGVIAIAISYFIIYHTMSVSIAQRRSEFGVLAAVGVAPRQVASWLLTEAVAVGVVSTLLGILIGIGLAAISVRLFGTVTASWLGPTVADLRLLPGPLYTAAAMGLVVSSLAAYAATRLLFNRPVIEILRSRFGAGESLSRRRALQLLGLGCLATGAVLIAGAPRSLDYASLVAFVLGANSLVMIGCALLSAYPTRVIAGLADRLSRGVGGVSVEVGASTLLRRPQSGVAVTIAIVMAFGFTLANGSLIASFRNSWFEWCDQFYPTDLIVTAQGAATDILGARPFPGEFVPAVRELSEVSSVQGIRRVASIQDGRPVMLVAVDTFDEGMPLVDAEWSSVAGAFQNGDAVLVSDTLAYATGIEVGDSVSLVDASAPFERTVAAIYKDVYGGGLGTIAIERSHYAQRWRDTAVDRVAVQATGDADAARRSINAAFAARYGVQAISFRAALDELRALVSDAFRLSYGLIFVCLVVSAIGIVNFLLASVIDRREMYRAMIAAGVPPRQIAGAVMSEGTIISVVGVVVGLIAGAVVSAVIILRCVPMVNGWLLELHFPWTMAAALAVSTVAVAMMSAFAPGRMASIQGRRTSQRTD